MDNLTVFAGFLLATLIMSVGVGVMLNGSRGAETAAKLWFRYVIAKPIAGVLRISANLLNGGADTIDKKKRRRRP